jgi:hypothetical protein
MKKLLFVFIAVLSLLIASQGFAQTVLQKITVALNTVNLEVNGEKVGTDNILYKGTTYVPLRSAAEMLDKEVTWDQETMTAGINDPEFEPSPLTQTINGVKVKINKVTQDADSLKVYVTYINKSNEEAMTGDSLAKIVSAGTQYTYESDFNFDRWYEKDIPHAAGFIEPTVTEESVIFFKPVSSETINIVLNANWEDYRFNNIKIQK